MNTDHNALLLQVMAHDLLAPLTAVKWQLELLGKAAPDDPKRFQYLQGIQDSTHLGIALTKHAHVAGRVLTGSYTTDPVEASLSSTVRRAAEDLRMQYERHGLMLEVNVDDIVSTQSIDVELVSLFVWSLAKYFLTCTPANTTVAIRGLYAAGDGESSSFTIIGSAPNVPDASACVDVLMHQQARGSYDQTYVFAKLIADTAKFINATVTASTQGDRLVIDAAFDRSVLN